jgi:hypothetical protein
MISSGLKGPCFTECHDSDSIFGTTTFVNNLSVN